MKTQDVMTIASVALGTAALTVIGFWSAPLEAGTEGETPATNIARPRLDSRGIELTVDAPADRVWQAGDQPALELRAVNPTDQPATTSIRLVMTASSPADMMSRVIRLPSVLWQQPWTVTLRAHETKTFPVSTQTKLPGNSLIVVSLREADSSEKSVANAPALPRLTTTPTPQVVALSFSTVTPGTRSALAVIR